MMLNERPSAQVQAALIVVLTRGGSTARLVAKYRPSIPVLTVAVPVLTTDLLSWSCRHAAPNDTASRSAAALLESLAACLC